MLELLRDSVYLRYWLAVVTSFLGDAMAKITLIYLAATVSDAPVVFISLVIIAQLLPTGVLGAFIGVIADRLPPRGLLVGADVARIAIVLCMIPAQDSEPVLLVLILFEGVGKAFFETARISSIPKFVGGHSIPSAIALFQSTNNTINLVGPALGGVLIATANISLVLGINAATFAVSGVLLGSIAVLREVPTGNGATGGYRQAVSAGARAVFAVPSLRSLMTVLVPLMIVLGLFTTTFNAELLATFDLSAERFGLAQAVFGAGAIAAALTGPILMRRFGGDHVLIGAVALFGVTLLLLGPTDVLRDSAGLAAVLVWCVLVGMGANLFQVPVANIMLRDLPEEFRGRGVGLINALIINLSIIGVALGSVTGTFVGIGASLIIAGAVLLLVSAVFVPVLRRHAALERAELAKQAEQAEQADPKTVS